ncbi:hypothetical protein GCM10011529_05190 [Polymorphobacter glacialis]|uniref:Methyltransferase FkbM domain-containing protein n=1 Tax=Sandarakinorhabdus glacialis TaxID=1614636 RepID=A0A916ZK42_9SPHN|nr:FkbM family methyltransferase [Polymorphobacter glacialis]GGE01783.1 hypothetical protein GCM10011529_05190 [Polymorphobacter glacialis]
MPDAVGTLGDGECFVDVGANCGVFALLAAQRVGPGGLVVAFEPCFETFATLVRNIGLNASGNVLAFNMAIADATGPELLDNSRPSHSGRFAIVRGPALAGETVASLSLDDFPGILRLIDRRSVLVKIDVEGFELAALQGLAPLLAYPRTRGVVVEIDASNLGQYGATPSAVFDLLQDHGFGRIDDVGESGHFDAVFARDIAATEPGRMARFPRRPAWQRSGEPVRAGVRNGVRGGWRRFAAVGAMLAVVATGWAVGTRRTPQTDPALEYFVDDALQSHRTAQVRTRFSPAIARLDADEVGAALRIEVPDLPAGWRVVDVFLFPSDTGPSLQLSISNGKAGPISLFATRADGVAPSRPSVTQRDGMTIAYWQHGSLAYALTGKRPPADLDLLAKDIAKD